MAGRIDQSIGAPQHRPDLLASRWRWPAAGRCGCRCRRATCAGEQWTALALVGAGHRCCPWWSGPGSPLLTARRLVTPLTDVARRAARLGSGDFRTFRRRYGIAELDRVADVLDSSAQDIAALIARERDLAGDISHQLRTRLTGLRLRLEELADYPDPQVAEEVQEALEQTDRLVTVVDDLLANARSERAAGAGEVVLFDELAEIETEWGPRLPAPGRTLTVRCPRDVRRARHRRTAAGGDRGAGGELAAARRRRGRDHGAVRRPRSAGWSCSRSATRAPGIPGRPGRARLRPGGVDGVVDRHRAGPGPGVRRGRRRPAGAAPGRAHRSSRSSWRSGRRSAGAGRPRRTRRGCSDRRSAVGPGSVAGHRTGPAAGGSGGPADVSADAGGPVRGRSGGVPPWCDVLVEPSAERCRRSCILARPPPASGAARAPRPSDLRVRGQLLGEDRLAVRPEPERHSEHGADDVRRR